MFNRRHSNHQYTLLPPGIESHGSGANGGLQSPPSPTDSASSSYHHPHPTHHHQIFAYNARVRFQSVILKALLIVSVSAICLTIFSLALRPVPLSPSSVFDSLPTAFTRLRAFPTSVPSSPDLPTEPLAPLPPNPNPSLGSRPSPPADVLSAEQIAQLRSHSNRAGAKINPLLRSTPYKIRPLVPHPVRPLPPPPPSSPAICQRCGCTSDRQIQREFDQPDLKVLHQSSLPLIEQQSIASHPIAISNPATQHLTSQVWSSIRDVYCQHALLSSEAALQLLDRSEPDSQHLSDTIYAYLDPLKTGIATQYVFTKTSEMSKTKALRADYFKRHIKTITEYLNNTKKPGYTPLQGTEQKWGTGPRQLVWLIIEDGEKLADDIKEVMSSYNKIIPFVYFVYGPTHRYGNAQQNAAYGLIHRMSKYVGHGPVLSIDDDGKVLSELFEIVWRVNRLGVWPMGNLSPAGWEGPEYDEETHEFITWNRSEGDDRPFPVDNGGFAFASEILGTNIRLKGPRYWPTDYPGGESEFVSQILHRQDLVEPLCYNCHLAWHNQRLTPDCLAHKSTCTDF